MAFHSSIGHNYLSSTKSLISDSANQQRLGIHFANECNLMPSNLQQPSTIEFTHSSYASCAVTLHSKISETEMV